MRTTRRSDGRTVRTWTLAAVLVLTVCPSVRLSAQMALPPGRPIAITNATIVPVVGERIPRGTVLIQDGRIAAVGANVAVPADAQVIDATGLFVYPGMIDAGTDMGLIEIGQGADGGDDRRELANGEFNPQDLALTAVNPFSEIIPTVRVNGVTSTLTAPTGGQISGQAALIELSGWTPQEMAVVARAGMVMTYPRGGGGGRFGGGGGGGGGRLASTTTFTALRSWNMSVTALNLPVNAK